MHSWWVRTLRSTALLTIRAQGISTMLVAVSILIASANVVIARRPLHPVGGL
jgi:hypothetical protein